MQTRTTKTKILIGILLSLCLAIPFGLLYASARLFGPGSYPFVERYKIRSDEASVIKAIDIFFERNEQYRLPVDSYLRNSQCTRNGYWYHVYFYLPDENRYLYAWTREGMDSKNVTTFALVAISRDLEPGNWLRVNDDLSRKETRRVKKEFKKQILAPIKAILNENETD